jgi:tetratricopeptide (TPR) repeat protein
MSAPDLNDTQPGLAAGGTRPNRVNAGEKKRFPRWLPVVIVVVLILTGILGGYGSGMGLRYSAQASVLNAQLAGQFILGQQAMEAGQYEVAKQHFEFIINQNPDYPGVKAAYADLLLRMQITPTLTQTSTPSFTPTNDLRSAEEQFKSAQDLLKSRDWDGTLRTLDSLRKIAPTYNTAQVDGMYYEALYQRGWSKLRPAKCSEANLEGGIYDLTMAERFGPLDTNAEVLRIYARLYIAGSSFWDQDWKQAQDYFAQVMAAFPTLMDASCDNAAERWRQATIKVADQLAAAGDYCGAEEQYAAAFSVNSPDNKAVYPTATAVMDACNGGNNTSGGEATPEFTPTGGTPTLGGETPTPTLTPEPSLAPETPTETPTS